jgi:RNA polymerase sigma factor (sigma-70 family)
MQEWIILVEKARRRDRAAFDELIVKFRDMAVGYAYSLLKDFHLAEDAAQEAFIQAFRDLPSLQEAKAFPSWLRRIVFKFSDRIKRVKKPREVVMDRITDHPDNREEPALALEKKETERAVLGCVQALPERERTVTTLFYINGYSLAEVGSFLEVPLTTVKSRLFSARKQLKKRMVSMIKETLGEHAPDADFNSRIRKVLDQVPIVDFELYRKKEKGGIPRVPESVPFPSCVRSYLEYIGKGYEPEIIEAHGRKWRNDNSYVMAMGTSGAAFKLNWKPGWHQDNPVIEYLSDEPLAPQRKALEAMGISYEILTNDGANRERFVKKIKDSILKNGRPCIAQGVVGPAEECLITGFDKDGEVLIGWSFFQKMKEFIEDVEFEANGCFRKRNWYGNTPVLFVLGDRRERTDRETVYLQALEWAVQAMETASVRGGIPAGIAAYQAWMDTLMDDSQFTGGKVKELVIQYDIHHGIVGLLAECRFNASLFLSKIRKETSLSKKLDDAAGCFMEIHDTMWKIWNAVGGIGVNPAKAKRFARPDVRGKVIEFLKEAREFDRKALSYLKEAVGGR